MNLYNEAVYEVGDIIDTYVYPSLGFSTTILLG